uniref:CST complex subunit STN1 n=1 Tax=Sinocyclocheilus rhinocerous TaxID=307959 RepID=A0A673INV0_9TELE
MAVNPADADADELPSVLWGLDPVFSAYSRLYITDILQMKESRQVPGVYFYKTHPLFQVDVLGTVVYKREREDFYCYGVDDSTGVINCLCWKNEKWNDQGESTKCRDSSGSSRGFNIEDELKRLKQAERKSTVLEIGDLLRVRGTVKTSRDAREIRAISFYKVNDPLMAVQISRMLEMPQLYRKKHFLNLQKKSSWLYLDKVQRTPSCTRQGSYWMIKSVLTITSEKKCRFVIISQLRI